MYFMIITFIMIGRLSCQTLVLWRLFAYKGLAMAKVVIIIPT